MTALQARVVKVRRSARCFCPFCKGEVLKLRIGRCAAGGQDSFLNLDFDIFANDDGILSFCRVPSTSRYMAPRARAGARS